MPGAIAAWAPGLVAGLLVAATVLAFGRSPSTRPKAPGRDRAGPARLGPGGRGQPGASGRCSASVSWIMRRTFRRRRARAECAALPIALESVARSLRSGAALAQAVREAGAGTPAEVGEDLSRVADHASSAGLVAALDAWASARRSSDVRLAATALSLAAQTGGRAASAVDGVAASLRQRLAAADEIRALSTQARLSAFVIGAAPAAFALFSSAADDRAAAFLLGTPAGWTCLGIGLALDAAGLAWMTRITKAAA